MKRYVREKLEVEWKMFKQDLLVFKTKDYLFSMAEMIAAKRRIYLFLKNQGEKLSEDEWTKLYSMENILDYICGCLIECEKNDADEDIRRVLREC